MMSQNELELLRIEGTENYLRNREMLPLNDVALIAQLKEEIAALPEHVEREYAVRKLEHMAARHYVLSLTNPRSGHMRTYKALIAHFAQPDDEVLVVGSSRLRGDFLVAALAVTQKIVRLASPKTPGQSLTITDITRVMTASAAPV